MFSGRPPDAMSFAFGKASKNNRTNPYAILVQPYMRQQAQPRGITRIEVIGIILVVLILSAILIPMSSSSLDRQARLTKEEAQIRQIHQSMMVFSYELNGSLPLPSLIAPPTTNGDEDYSLNHSANFYSMLIMRHYLTPQLLISQFEISDYVLSDDDYDHSKYDPDNGSYWDDSFVMHIEDPKIGANSSYAHVAAIGDRRDALHAANLSSTMPIFGTRAYDSTKLDPSDYERSITNKFYKPNDEWVGIIAFADNHVERLDTFFPQQTTFDPGSGAVPDNIFAAEFDHPNGKQAAADAFLCISTAATQYTVTDVYDPLLDE